jgi:hypothetical protein
MNSFLAFFRGYGLERGNLLLHSGALTTWTPEFFRPVFVNRYRDGKRPIALLTDEFVYRHALPPLPCKVFVWGNTKS